MRNYKSWSVVVLKKKKKKYLNYFWLFSCVVLKRESHKIEMVIIAERCESPFKTEPVSLTQLNTFQGVLAFRGGETLTAQKMFLTTRLPHCVQYSKCKHNVSRLIFVYRMVINKAMGFFIVITFLHFIM